MSSGFEMEGRLSGKLAVQSGRSAKGEWARQDFLMEVQDGNFPSTVCFSLWGADRVKELEKYLKSSTKEQRCQIEKIVLKIWKILRSYVSRWSFRRRQYKERDRDNI